MDIGADRPGAAAPPRRGGRPRAAAAAQLGDVILQAATEAFLREGYAATSIESVAKRARIAKRTLYARFVDKETLFRAVLERLMGRWLASPEPEPPPAGIEAALVSLAERILAVALAPEALALHRLLVSEAGRFPEIPLLLRRAGAAAGEARIAALLTQEIAAGRLPPLETAFAAEQFMHLVLSGPRRRALGLGTPLKAEELAGWAGASVALFLEGCRHGLTV